MRISDWSSDVCSSDLPPSILHRDRYDGSVSMETSITRTLELNGMTVEDFDAVELYSCFPCVPKMARRILGWPWDRPATVFGGLTFGGGPIATYMSHAIVSMVEQLRREGRSEENTSELQSLMRISYA